MRWTSSIARRILRGTSTATMFPGLICSACHYADENQNHVCWGLLAPYLLELVHRHYAHPRSVPGLDGILSKLGAAADGK